MVEGNQGLEGLMPYNRDDISDEVPVADAAEQDQEFAPTPVVPDQADVPMEANAPDWQEQLYEVADDDRDEYR